MQNYEINGEKQAIWDQKLLSCLKQDSQNCQSEKKSCKRYKDTNDTKTLILIRKTSLKITIVKPNIFYIIYDT